MTDIENMEDVEGEKKESGYAKLRASLKEKYEGQINQLQAEVESLKSSKAADKKGFFNRILQSEGYEWDFTEFADKYSDLAVDEMVALYKGMNGVVKKEPASEPAKTEEPKQETLWAKSVLGSNPTAQQDTDSVEKMDWKQYLDYLKRNMGQLGLG